jgi:uncharacterized protein with PIN domain
VDGMLKGLMRLLRFLGFNAEEFQSFKTIKIDNCYYANGYFLTASSLHFNSWPYPQKILILEKSTEKQLHYLQSRLMIFKQIKLFSRCSICNTKLNEISWSEIEKKIPSIVLESFEKFYYCSVCHRIYWKGGHVRRMIDKLKRMGVPIKYTL